MAGEQIKWRPVLRDAYGKVVHSPGIVLLNPLSQPVRASVAQLVVQLVLPNATYSNRINNQPVTYLEHLPTPNHLQRATQLIDRLLDEHHPQRKELVRDAMAQYRLLNAAFDPSRSFEFRRGLGILVGQTLMLSGKRGELALDELLRLNPLYRVTYHPDLGVVGRQRIEQTNIPLHYKGVALQPLQIRHLLLGNTIEVTGILDPKRGTLYRAGVSFNLLSGKADEVSRREQITTDSKEDALMHRKAVSQQDATQFGTSPNAGDRAEAGQRTPAFGLPKFQKPSQ